MNVTTEKEIIKELKAIRKELTYIKEHMVDMDAILTPEEERILDEGIKEFKEGKAIKIQDLECPLKRKPDPHKFCSSMQTNADTIGISVIIMLIQ